MTGPVPIPPRPDLWRVVAPTTPVPAGLAERAARAALRSRPPEAASWLERVVPMGLVAASAAAATSALLWWGVVVGPGATALTTWDAWPGQMVASAYDPAGAWGVGGGAP